jgi:hypothetical protein
MSEQFAKLEMGPRNDPLGFAQRSYVNLRIIEQCLEEKGEGHVVTQLVQSLLAYIVFPKEKNYYDNLKSYTIQQVYGDNPPFVQMVGKTNNMNQLLRHLRNAVSHGLVVFHGSGPYGSNSRKLEEIFIEFSDRQDDDSPIDWQILIEGVRLRAFMFDMIERGM